MSADIEIHKVIALAARLREHDAERKVIVELLASAKGGLVGIVAEASGIHQDAITGKCRSTTVAVARKAWHYLLVEWTGLTVTEIGRMVKRDHTTVRHSHKTAPDCEKTMAIVARITAGKRYLPA